VKSLPPVPTAGNHAHTSNGTAADNSPRQNPNTQQADRSFDLSQRLNPRHLEALRCRYGLTDDAIDRGGFYTEYDPKKIAELLNWPSEQNAANLGACLVIPFLGPDGRPTGFQQLRPDNPLTETKENGKVRARKYESPAGVSPVSAYFPAGVHAMLAEPDPCDLLITEGGPKAAATAQHGFACVSISGVENFTYRAKDKQGNKAGPSQLIPDLARIAWRGRRVYIVFDSDAVTNENVRRAEWRLADELASRGATVRIVRLPQGPGGAKVGLDDYLLTHTPAQLQALLRTARVPRDPTRDSVAGMIERLKPLGKCDTPRWVRGHRDSSPNLHCVAGFPCDRNRCEHCLKVKLFNRFLSTIPYLERVTHESQRREDAEGNVDDRREKVAVGLRAEPVDKKLRRELSALAGQHDDDKPRSTDPITPEAALNALEWITGRKNYRSVHCAAAVADTLVGYPDRGGRFLTPMNALPVFVAWYCWVRDHQKEEAKKMEVPDESDLLDRLEKAIKRANKTGGEYLSVLTGNWRRCVEAAGLDPAADNFTLAQKTPCERHGEIVPQPVHFVAITLPVAADPPDGFVVVDDTDAALTAIGTALATVPPPPADGSGPYRPVSASHGWGDELTEPPRGDFRADGPSIFTVKQTKTITTALGVSASAKKIRRSVGQPAGYDAGGPARTLVLDLMLGGEGDAPPKPTEEQVITLARVWHRMIPNNIGDGNEVRRLLLSKLWNPWSVTREAVQEAHQQDVNAAAEARILADTDAYFRERAAAGEKLPGLLGEMYGLAG
jgi:hypothetical protein